MTSWIGNRYEPWPQQLLARSFDTLRVDEARPHVLRVAINRSDAANAFATVTARELHEVFAPLEIVRMRFRCVVPAGAGDEAFSPGGDLKERKSRTFKVLMPLAEWAFSRRAARRRKSCSA